MNKRKKTNKHFQCPVGGMSIKFSVSSGFNFSLKRTTETLWQTGNLRMLGEITYFTKEERPNSHMLPALKVLPFLLYHPSSPMERVKKTKRNINVNKRWTQLLRVSPEAECEHACRPTAGVPLRPLGFQLIPATIWTSGYDRMVVMKS